MAEPIPVTDYNDLNKLWTNKIQCRDPARSALRPVNALDAETFKGNVFLIADSDGRFLDKITPASLIEFLFHKKYQGAWNFFYSPYYDAEVILKAILNNELSIYRYTRRLSFPFGDYTLVYYPNKCLKISKRHHSAVFHDISQFYGFVSLEKAYQDNIGPLTQDYLDMKMKRGEFSSRFYRRNTSAVRAYCISDCIHTRKLAEKFIQLFHDIFGFYTRRWLSGGYLAEKILINNGIDIPKFSSIPYEIQELATKAYFGARIEMLKRGFIGEAYLYDINSAYPDKIAKIPDLTDGEWIKGNVIHPDAKIGFFKISGDVPDDEYIAPFPFKANHTLVFPNGRFKTYVTLDELRTCRRTDFYKILESWQFIPNSDYCPYEDFIRNLYQERLELKEAQDPRESIIKLILNSIYGKTGQKTNLVIGNLFYPVIFATITGSTRAQLYKFVLENGLEHEIVGFATDSICTRKELDLDSSRLGEFSFKDHAEDVFYLQNGIYRFNDEWKQRGIGKLDGKVVKHLKTYEKNGRLYWEFQVMRSARLRLSIIQNQISEIGKIRPIIRKVNLNADRKRFWLGKLESIDSNVCNDSMPLSLNRFEKDEI